MAVVKTDRKLSLHFRAREFACRCRRPECDALPMSQAFIDRLESLRVDWAIPMLPTSGARCRHWNRIQGGALLSLHLEGRAADFYFTVPGTVERFAALAEKHGFNGIGTGKHKCHIDDREHRARWTYD